MKIIAFIIRYHARLRVNAHLRKQRRLEQALMKQLPAWLQRDIGLMARGADIVEVPRQAVSHRPKLIVIDCNAQAVRQGHRHKVVHRRRFAVFRRDEKRRLK